MSTLRYLAIDPERLDAVRRRGADEFGNPWQPRAAEGWEPLRCCLRTAGEGEDIALISYSPWPVPWDTPWGRRGRCSCASAGARATRPTASTRRTCAAGSASSTRSTTPARVPTGTGSKAHINGAF